MGPSSQAARIVSPRARAIRRARGVWLKPRATRIRYAGATKTVYRAGPKIGVASTKAFTTQLTAFFLLSLYVRQLRGDDSNDLSYAMHEMRVIPHKLETILKKEKQIQELAHRMKSYLGWKPHTKSTSNLF